jgi:hypothetical protein
MEQDKDITFDADAYEADRVFTLNETQLNQIYDNLLKLEADVNNGKLSPRDTANKIRLINDYINIVSEPIKQ